MKTKRIKISETSRINSLAQDRIRAGLPVFNLGTGEPIVEMLPSVKNAGKNAIDRNDTLYPPVAGIPELRKEVCAWLNSSYNSRFKPENVLVTNGGKLGIYLTLQALLRPRDEVVIVAPYWVSYPNIVEIFGGKPKIVKTSEKSGWKITPEQLEKACTKKTKIFIFNNACNPTGALYSRGEVFALLKVAEKNNLTVISDEVYSGLVYDGREFASCASFPKFSNRVIVIQSCSKNFAMTGWRVGFVCASKEIISTLTNLLSQSTSGVTTVGQWVALEALKNQTKITQNINLEMQKRRDLLVHLLEKKFDTILPKPASSLYLFISLSKLGINAKNSSAFCKRILKNSGVVMVSGSAFGAEGYVRLSFGGRAKVIQRAVDAL